MSRVAQWLSSAKEWVISLALGLVAAWIILRKRPKVVTIVEPNLTDDAKVAQTKIEKLTEEEWQRAENEIRNRDPASVFNDLLGASRNPKTGSPEDTRD